MIGSNQEAPSEHWTDSLRAMFPIARTTGFSCFEGWKPIIVGLLGHLSLVVKELPADEQRTFAVVEIRQKFGTLTVYLSGGTTSAMSEAIDAAREASMVTCEVCGAQGTLAERRGWTSVKCDAHQNWSRFDPRPAIPSA